MTLKAIYESVKANERPITPANAFVKELAEVTKKSEVAVRRWLSDGKNSTMPDALTQDILAKHFGTTVDELFPKNNQPIQHQ